MTRTLTAVPPDVVIDHDAAASESVLPGAAIPAALSAARPVTGEQSNGCGADSRLATVPKANAWASRSSRPAPRRAMASAGNHGSGAPSHARVRRPAGVAATAVRLSRGAASAASAALVDHCSLGAGVEPAFVAEKSGEVPVGEVPFEGEASR
ncbi:hypothetical protein [Actinomadura pelletieri]|uniref:hypothetical protein n=1 Tax=Actinomadura pelletieri TaxID=111805 RepID=UPI000EABBF84|nr:hypothetical protein [Actinomadura pelletieri]